MPDTVDAEGLSLGVDEDGVPLVLLPSGAPLPLVRRLTVEADMDDAVLLKIEVIACRPPGSRQTYGQKYGGSK